MILYLLTLDMYGKTLDPHDLILRLGDDLEINYYEPPKINTNGALSISFKTIRNSKCNMRNIVEFLKKYCEIIKENGVTEISIWINVYFNKSSSICFFDKNILRTITDCSVHVNLDLFNWTKEKIFKEFPDKGVK